MAAFIPKIISANDLLYGDVVYLTDAHRWTRLLQEAVVATAEESLAELLSVAGGSDLVVGPYAVDVALVDDGFQLLHFRERLREQGPSV